MNLDEALDAVLELARPTFRGERDTMDEEEEARYSDAISTIEEWLESRDNGEIT